MSEHRGALIDHEHTTLIQFENHPSSVKFKLFGHPEQITKIIKNTSIIKPFKGVNLNIINNTIYFIFKNKNVYKFSHQSIRV